MASEITELHVADVPEERSRRHRAQVRTARFDDYAQIAKLLLRNGLTIKPCSEWAALWQANPAYLRTDGAWPIGWVIEREDGRIAGSIANVPLDYCFQGKPLLAAASCSWAVDPDYRPYSMLLLDTLTNQPGLDLLVSTTVSASVEPAFRMLHWSKAPKGTWDRSAFWITDYAGFSRHFLKMKAAPMPGLLSYVFSAALLCWDALEGFRFRDGATDAESICDFDGRFDEFWRQWESENFNQLLAVRTRETLKWHFGTSLARGDAWILAALRGSRLVAYAIFDRHEDSVLGFKRVRLVDFAALRECEEDFASILRSALDECRRQGAHFLQTTGLWLRDSLLAACPPAHHRSLPSWSFYYRAANPSLASVLKNSNVWMPTSFDGDASL